MSEFIPTTEQVRGQFVFVEHFDSWLAQHDTETVKATEERIIALLEVRHNDLSSCPKDDECHSLKWGIDLAISDIEGDDK